MKIVDKLLLIVELLLLVGAVLVAPVFILLVYLVTYVSINNLNMIEMFEKEKSGQKGSADTRSTPKYSSALGHLGLHRGGGNRDAYRGGGGRSRRRLSSLRQGLSPSVYRPRSTSQPRPS